MRLPLKWSGSRSHFIVHKFATAALSLLERAFGVVVRALTVFITGRKTPAYHPSRHYMRGPGPKWIAKHGVAHASEFFPHTKHRI